MVSIPFYIWNMLGTLPLRAAYLQQLLHICQAMQFQPTPYTSPAHPDAQSLTSRTYSNSSIERINSALAAQWSNPSAALAAHAASGCGNMTTDAAAAAGRAASCACGPMTAGAAKMHQQLGDTSRQLTDHMSGSPHYQAYDRPSSNISVPSHDLSQSPFPPGFRQTTPQTRQGAVQYGPDGQTAGATAAVAEGIGSASPWELGSGTGHATTLQQQSRLYGPDHHRSDSGSRADADRGDQGRAMHEAWTGQGQAQTGAGSGAPLDPVQYDAVAALQSLALQLQATGAFLLLLP